jgi:hypothetical protein
VDKTIYYISVADGLIESESVLRGIPNKNYEFVVHAADEEIAELRRRMDKVQSDEETTFKRATIPYKSADHDVATNAFNSDMLSLYHMIYELGNDEAKQHIEKMGILGRLLSPDYHHAGYSKNKNGSRI